MEIIYSLRSKALNIFILIRQQFKKKYIKQPNTYENFTLFEVADPSIFISD